MIRVIGDIVKQAAKTHGQKTAVYDKSRKQSFGEIYGEAVRLASLLREKKVTKGDRVCFFMEKRMEKVISIWGIALSGGVFVPIRKLSTADQVVHICNDCRPSILITTMERLHVLKDALASMDSLTTIMVIDGKGQDTADIPGIAFVDWSQEPAGPPDKFPLVIPTDLAAILYTSGSTGRPKGVVLTHLNIVEGAKKVSQYLEIEERDRLLSILTFGFDYGLNQLMTSFLCKAQLVLFDYLFPKDIITISRKMEVTAIAAVSATWIQLAQIDWDAGDLPSLRYITNSGGAIPRHHVLTLHRRLPHSRIYLMYGLTEAFRSTYLDPRLVAKYPTSMGKAIPGEEILVVDKSGVPVKKGEVGELVHRGVLVAQGYWNDAELTALRFKPDPLQKGEVKAPQLAVFSGDKVKLGEEGLLFFVGRDDEMIKCAGNRISPTEVEEYFYKSGLVETGMALGVPHSVYGQAVMGVVVPLERDSFTTEKLVGYCKSNMPAYMVPVDILVRENLPQNTNGKLDRSKISKEILSRFTSREKQ